MAKLSEFEIFSDVEKDDKVYHLKFHGYVF